MKTSHPSVRYPRVVPKTLLCLTLFVPTFISGQAFATEDGDLVPDDQCVCSRAPMLIVEGLLYETRCRMAVKGGAVSAFGNEEQERKIRDTTHVSCNNCAGCTPLDCHQTLSLTRTDQGSVSGTASFSVELGAQINCNLAGAAHISTTSEFRNGYTSTTTVSVTVEVQAGSVQPPCHWNEITLTQYATPVHTRQPLTHMWEVRTRMPGQEWSDWRPQNTCRQTIANAHLHGERAIHHGVENKAKDCGPCPECEPSPTSP